MRSIERKIGEEVLILPEYVVFQSKYNQKYLEIVTEEGDLHGLLRFSADTAVSPYTKFQVQESSWGPDYVNIRSCYNNKYWTPGPDKDAWLRAAADEPVEDDNTELCTMFCQYSVDGDPKAVRFLHASIIYFAALMIDPGESRDACMYLDPTWGRKDLADVFTFIDWTSLPVLPQYVAFKGGPEGMYLCSRPVDSVRYLQFVGDDLADPTAGHEVFTFSEETVSVKSEYYDKFWTRTSSSFVLADTQDSDITNKEILFSPTKIEGDVFVFRSLGNNDYCKSIDFVTPAGEEVIALSAADGTVTALSHLEVVDRAVSRSVYVDGSDFRVSHARVTAPKPVVLVAGDVFNEGDAAVDMTVNLSFEAECLTSTWGSTVNGSLRAGVKVDIMSPIPVEVNGEISATGMTTGDKAAWGVEEIKSRTLTEMAYKVQVPSLTKATVQARGVKRLWDIPFSYKQTLTLIDGTEKCFRMDDGLYTGTRIVFEDYKVEFVPIS